MKTAYKLKGAVSLILLLCTISLILTGCINLEGEGADDFTNEASVAGMQIKLSFDGGEAYISLVDNSATRDLVSRLKKDAMLLTFSDFAGSEKIAYPPSPLDVSNASGCDPVVGDLTIYKPWGNFAAFYRDSSGYSQSLVRIGQIENNAITSLAAQRGEFNATLELAA